MKFRHSLILIVFAGVIITAIATVMILIPQWQAGARRDQKTQVLNLVEAVRSWSESLNHSLADDLNSILETEWNSPAPTSAFLSSEFKAIALLTQGDGASWNIEWWRSQAANLDRDWVQKNLKTSRWFALKGGEVYWQRLVQQDGHILFAIVVPMEVQNGETVKNKVAVGFAGPGLFALSPFASADGSSDIFVVDQIGNAVGYPDIRYVGSKIDSHPLVADLIRSPSPQEIRNFKMGDRQAVGCYEHVANSNLYVVSSKLLPDPFGLAMAAAIPVGETTGVILIVLLLISAMVLGRDARMLNVLRQNLQLARRSGETSIDTPAVLVSATPASTPKETAKTVTATAVSVQPGDKSLEVTDFGRTIVEFLRGPLTAASGFVQMLESQLANPSALSLNRQLGDVVRSSRDFVESLAQEMHVPELKFEPVELQAVLNAVVAVQKSEMLKQQIQVEENFLTDVRVKADFHRLKAALTALIRYAIEFLGDAAMLSGRRIVLNVEKLGGVVQIRIEAKGRDLPAESRRKFFLPFAIKIRAKNYFGFDIALAKARLSEMNGDVQVESTGPDSFQFICKVPVASPVFESPAPSAQAITQPGVQTAAPQKIDAIKVESIKIEPIKFESVQVGESKAEPAEAPLQERLVKPHENPTLPPPPEESATMPPVQSATPIATELSDEQPVIQIRKPKVRTDG